VLKWFRQRFTVEVVSAEVVFLVLLAETIGHYICIPVACYYIIIGYG